MAQKIHVELVDDIDGSSAAETVTFGLDGTHYEIDLSGKNATKLRKSLSPFLENSRRVTKTGKRTQQRPAAKTNGNAKSVRQWARENGFTVNDRGAIPAEVRQAYESRSDA